MFKIDGLKTVLIDQPAYRQTQILRLIFVNLIEKWDEATALPLNLRQQLEKTVPLEIEAEIFAGTDKNSFKAIVRLDDGSAIETVLMKHIKGRNTVCVSSQVGCPLGCSFCATGKMGFKRNLNEDEIVAQVLLFARKLKASGEKVTNIVFMGEGEPFLNYENVMGAVRRLHDSDGFNLGSRHFSISTAGITEGIEKLAGEDLEINLAISLHAPENSLRSKLMPVNKHYPIEAILKAVDYYIQKTRRKVMFEYILIREINDTEECARKLASLLKHKLCFVNLIAYNPTGVYRTSLPETIKWFKEILEQEGLSVTQRYRFGDEIQAACGQLVGQQKED